MIFSFLKRGREHKELKLKVENMHNTIHSSFNYIKSDLSSIGSWLNHFKAKHENHDEKYAFLLARINKLESALYDIRDYLEADEDSQKIKEPQKLIEIEEKEFVNEEDEDPLEFNESVWDTLTETQQKICWKLALLQKETPEQWISLKYLAQELYPYKDYNQVRSTVSQFISGLEDLGFVKRRRKGKLAYIYSTKKNPCYGKKKKLFIEAKI